MGLRVEATHPLRHARARRFSLDGRVLVVDTAYHQGCGYLGVATPTIASWCIRCWITMREVGDIAPEPQLTQT
jgi:hypothetical protein